MDGRGALRKTVEVMRRLHWTRGLRAGVAVAAAMTVCHLLGKPMGWAALGGFEAILVDNGGPYRSRFATIFTLMVGGTLACLAGTAAVGSSPRTALLASVAVTASFCFAVTFARVAAQPVASTSVIILVIYFAALGGSEHTFRDSLWNALAFVLGAAWAAALSLVLWPVDPFRPARLAVSNCYRMLAEFSAGIEPTERGSEERELVRRRNFEWHRRLRLQMEAARTALGATAARMPTRTVRARNLTVLLETADMLFAGAIQTDELALALEVEDGGRKDSGGEPAPLAEFVRRLSGTERSIAEALQRKPLEGEVACLPPEGREAERLRPRVLSPPASGGGRAAVLAHLAAAEGNALQNLEIACEAVNAVWSGVESRPGRLTAAVAASGSAKPRAWLEALRANWTLDSVMMRHALRAMVVGGVDVLLLRAFHVSHGSWLGMTSVIVLQPYQSNTLKRGVERVGGTIAGGVLAAVLAAAIHSQAVIIAVIAATSVLTLATYAVDYAWYCFFLTPTFVLMSLPHLRDWQYAGVRMLTTMVGAAVAVAAMRLLWPEREHLALGRSLARSSAADAAYIRALLRYWGAIPASASTSGRSGEDRRRLERELLAPARRACGLASNDAEESLDRLMQESGFGRLVATSAPAALIKEHALTFVTYMRRLTQSVTTLAVLGRADRDSVARLEQLAVRLEAMSAALIAKERALSLPPEKEEQGGGFEEERDIATHQMQRMQRQVRVLERTAAGLANAGIS